MTHDDEDFSAVCKRLETALAYCGYQHAIQTLGTKTKHKPHENPFAGLQDEGESDPEGAEEQAEEGVDPTDKNTERQGGSSEEEEDEDDKGWTDVTTKGKSSIKAVTKLKTQEECDYFSLCYNKYFECYTGKNLNFLITPESQPYVSAFEACLRRDQILASLFDRRPTIVDPFGGSGGDMSNMLFNLWPEQVFISDAVFGHDKRRRMKEGGVMQQNYENMMHLFEELTQGKDGMPAPVVHKPKMMECVDFLQSLPQGLGVHILYLDPCWAMPGEDHEMSPDQMARYLKQNVFDPLVNRDITPQCIVLKTRWGAQHLGKIMDVLGRKHYDADYSIEATPFREYVETSHKFEEAKGRFHWVILVHHELKSVVWQQSQAYKNLFKEHKDVIVLRSTFARPNIPIYANRIRFPVVVDHEDGFKTLRVTAPQRGKQQARKKQRAPKRS